MEPAKTIIRMLGGAAKVAAITGVHVSGVYKWTWSRDVGGTDGIIPFNHAPVLLKAANEMGVELNANDFLPVGASRLSE
jgi:hypothetical protein